MLSERAAAIQAETKARDAKGQALHLESQGPKDAANAAVGKEKELNDKLKQKNAQLAQLGKERGELVQELAKSRQIIAKVGGAEEAAAAGEEQHRATQAMTDQIQKLEADLAKAKDETSALTGKIHSFEGREKD